MIFVLWIRGRPLASPGLGEGVPELAGRTTRQAPTAKGCWGGEEPLERCRLLVAMVSLQRSVWYGPGIAAGQLDGP